MRFKAILVGFLLMLFFVPAAGAIYIPGQETPDDGLYHIMSAGEGTMAPNLGISGGISLPSMLSIPFQASYGINVYPIMAMPQIDESGNINLGAIIGHIVTPPMPGYWDNIDPGSLNINMPII